MRKWFLGIFDIILQEWILGIFEGIDQRIFLGIFEAKRFLRKYLKTRILKAKCSCFLRKSIAISYTIARFFNLLPEGLITFALLYNELGQPGLFCEPDLKPCDTAKALRTAERTSGIHLRFQ